MRLHVVIEYCNVSPTLAAVARLLVLGCLHIVQNVVDVATLGVVDLGL